MKRDERDLQNNIFGLMVRGEGWQDTKESLGRKIKRMVEQSKGRWSNLFTPHDEQTKSEDE